jgi:hypothetical protein
MVDGRMNMTMFQYILVLLFIAAICLSFAIGYRRGKKSRKIDLAGLGAKEAFAYFLTHEISRHRSDISKAKIDLKKLTDKGINAPDIPVGLWIEVRK